MDLWPWLIGVVVAVAAWALWSFWKVHANPAQKRLRQAISMNWVVAGEVKKDGYRIVRLTRENEEVVISYKTCDVHLIRPHLALTFDDFVELEQWLAREGERPKEEEDDDDEQLRDFRVFFRAFERIIALHGYFEELISAQGTDEQFAIASMKLLRAGAFARKTPDTVAALVVKALAQYDKNRTGALEFLAKHGADYELEAARHCDASGEYNRAGKPTQDVVTPQYDADMAHLRLLAEQGDSTAQSMLGVFYASGEGVPQSDAEALKWLRLAADQGDATAQGFLASMYARGQGVPQNDGEAVKWYRLAADQGDANAQVMLGLKYGSGVGVKPEASCLRSRARSSPHEIENCSRDSCSLIQQVLGRAAAYANKCSFKGLSDEGPYEKTHCSCCLFQRFTQICRLAWRGGLRLRQPRQGATQGE